MKSRINKLEYTFEIHKNFNRYYKNNRFHREKDLPSIIWEDGSRLWFKNGLEHRDNGKPSSIFSNGRIQWYENGYLIKRNF